MFKHGVLLDVQCSVKGLICSFDKVKSALVGAFSEHFGEMS